MGEFPPGANLPERETSAALGVSRTPLREALRILANEGLVEVKPARSPVVADPSAADLADGDGDRRPVAVAAGDWATVTVTDSSVTVHFRHHVHTFALPVPAHAAEEEAAGLTNVEDL